MGIGLGITEDSIMKCKYSLCKEFRNEIVEYTIKRTGDEWYDHLFIRRVGFDEKGIKKIIFPEGSNLDDHYAYEYKTVRTVLKKKKEDKPPSNPIEALISEKENEVFNSYFVRWVDEDEFKRDSTYAQNNNDGNTYWITSKWHNDYDFHSTICPKCPLSVYSYMSPSCYSRFSNYPGMTNFKAGLLATSLFLLTEANKINKENIFAFPRVLLGKHDNPRDSAQELFDELHEVEVNSEPESFFNGVFNVLEKSGMEDIKANKIINSDNNSKIPISVDAFCTKFLYREDNAYNKEEADKYLPKLRLLKISADYLIWEHGNEQMIRKTVLNFQDRITCLITMLELVSKYDVEMYVSY